MAIPNTTTFTLQDVCDELGLSGTGRNLVNCFTVASRTGFNASYEGDRNSLYNFRAYNNTTNTDTMSISPSSINSLGQGEAHTITVTSNTTWSVIESESWISISGASGSGNDTFSLITTNNNTGATRYASVTVTTGNSASTISISQPIGFA